MAGLGRENPEILTFSFARRNIKMSNVLFDEDGELFLSDMAIPRTDSTAASGYHMRHACYNSCAKKKGQHQVPFYGVCFLPRCEFHETRFPKPLVSQSQTECTSLLANPHEANQNPSTLNFKPQTSVPFTAQDSLEVRRKRENLT